MVDFEQRRHTVVDATADQGNLWNAKRRATVSEQ